MMESTLWLQDLAHVVEGGGARHAEFQQRAVTVLVTPFTMPKCNG